MPASFETERMARDLKTRSSGAPGPKPCTTREHAMDTLVVNKRRQRRLPVRPPGPSSRPSGIPAYRVVDISRSGCLLESMERLGRVASVIPLELPVPTRTDRPVVRAKIVWVREGQGRGGRPCFRYGISFRDMDRASQRALDLYLDYLQRDHHLNRLDEAWRRHKAPRTQ